MQSHGTKTLYASPVDIGRPYFLYPLVNSHGKSKKASVEFVSDKHFELGTLHGCIVWSCHDIEGFCTEKLHTA